MDKYTVKFYKRAIRDIDGIYAYIALEKQSPGNAKGQSDRNCAISRAKQIARIYDTAGVREGKP